VNRKVFSLRSKGLDLRSKTESRSATFKAGFVYSRRTTNSPTDTSLKFIRLADPEDTKDLFFFDMETNAGYFRNLTERSLSFVYFFSGQYDPSLGSITSIEISEA
jgi:hypothetical protein